MVKSDQDSVILGQATFWLIPYQPIVADSAPNILFLNLHHVAIVMNLYTCKSWQVSCHGFHIKKSTNYTQLIFYI